MSKPVLATEVTKTFTEAALGLRRAPKTRPISVRFTEAELSCLRERAGKLPLGTYIREQALGGRVDKGRSQRHPKVNQPEFAALLGALQQSRLASNLNQLSRAANIGVLDTTPEVKEQLKDAYRAVMAMREALFTALGLRSK